MESKEALLGGIEAGGTKYVCAIGYDPSEPLLESRFSSVDPKTTMAKTREFFENAEKEFGPIQSLGIGTFGPADINVESPTYGSILTTPKEKWAGFKVLDAIRDGFSRDLPIAFETDVNAAVIGEACYGAATDLRYVAYITIGTGIGGAYLHDGQLISGRMHTEVGHMVMPDFDSEYGASTNVCPFHSSCFEGRAAGPAIEARWGKAGFEIPDDDAAWDLEAKYLAAGCINLTAVWSPDIILLGGGVSQKPGLIEKVRVEFEKQAGGYWNLPPLDNYLKTPALDQKAGIVGALTLARRLLVPKDI